MVDPSAGLVGNLLLFFVIGLLGGAHCIGMCGPLVTMYASRMDTQAEEGYLTSYQVRQHGLFNLGRTISYATIGAVFGALGSLLYVTTGTLTAVTDLIRGSVGTGMGLLVIVIGIYYLLGRNAVGGHVPGLGLERVFGVLTNHVDRLAAGPGIIGLGALHGLLPCPILYPAFLYAFAVGSPTVGFASLAALGVGTLPAVFLYGTVIDSVDPARRRNLHRVLGAAFVVLGYVLFAHGLMSVGIHLPHPSLPHYQPLGGA
jgi:sulfite exporter TauE/SafE